MRRSLDGIEYNYIDPTGNITILVESDVSPKDYAAVAKRLMGLEKKCEQVGFVKKSDHADIRLDMAAGEFCGNATMSAAALFCNKEGMKPGGTRKVVVESSGTENPVSVNITREGSERGDGPCVSYRGSVRMPNPRGIDRRILEYKGRNYTLPVVDMDGISHIITSSNELGMTDSEVEYALKIWWEDIRSSCLGIIIADNVERAESSGVLADVRPLVYAPDVETCFWETSCASGTTALLYYLNDADSSVIRLKAKEPGGELEVGFFPDKGLLLTGTVTV